MEVGHLEQGMEQGRDSGEQKLLTGMNRRTVGATGI